MSTTLQATHARIEPALQDALSKRHAPEPAGRFTDTMTFAWRALLKVKHMPEQMFDVVVTPVMFTVLFTFMFGGALAGSPAAYLQFLLPGILVQTVTFTTVYTGFTLNTDISRGVYDRFKSMPIWQPAPVVGAMAGDTIRYTVSSIIVVLIGLVLGYRPATGFTGVVASILLLNVFAFGIGWVFTTVALWVSSPSTVLTLSWVVIMPLTFASNIYVDPATMPGWLQAFVAVNPVTHIVTATRGLLDGAVSTSDIALSLLTPALVTLVCAPIAMRLYRRER
jgi:ABC-2 type transport system permease protein